MASFSARRKAYLAKRRLANERLAEKVVKKFDHFLEKLEKTYSQNVRPRKD